MTQTGLSPRVKIFPLVAEDKLEGAFNKWAGEHDEIFRITLATPIRTVDHLVTLAVFYDVLGGTTKVEERPPTSSKMPPEEKAEKK